MGDRDALAVRLADAALRSRVPSAPAWEQLPEYIRDIWLGDVRGILAEVEAYGDERAKSALGELYAQRGEMDCPTRKAVYDGLRCTCSRPHAPIPHAPRPATTS